MILMMSFEDLVILKTVHYETPIDISNILQTISTSTEIPGISWLLLTW